MTRAPARALRPSHRLLADPAAAGVGRSSAVCRPLRRCARAALGAAAAGLVLSSACGDDSSPPVLTADAGPTCERGTRNCACIGGSGCRDDLLCISGVCSVQAQQPPPEMLPRPRPRPTPPVPGDPDRDAGSPPAPVDGGALDAAAPGEGDASAPAPDAGNDAG